MTWPQLPRVAALALVDTMAEAAGNVPHARAVAANVAQGTMDGRCSDVYRAALESLRGHGCPPDDEREAALRLVGCYVDSVAAPMDATHRLWLMTRAGVPLAELRGVA